MGVRRVSSGRDRCRTAIIGAVRYKVKRKFRNAVSTKRVAAIPLLVRRTIGSAEARATRRNLSGIVEFIRRAALRGRSNARWSGGEVRKKKNRPEWDRAEDGLASVAGAANEVLA